jgi:predicted transcriptional regulator of viral defense system
MAATTPDQRAERLAARQHWLLTREQALRCGLSSRQIERRVASGRWAAVQRGLYRLAAAPITWQQRVLAACLGGPPGTVASHLTAAALHGLTPAPARPHVTVPRRAWPVAGQAIVHRGDLDPRDRLIVTGVPCTCVARTPLDCASTIGHRRLCDLVDTAFCERLSHTDSVAEAIARAQRGRGRRGVAALRQATSAWSPGIEPGSPAEMRLLRQLAAWGVEAPTPQIELREPGGALIARIDLGWPARRVGLEYDSDRYHNPRNWPRDEPRQVRFEIIGWQVHRVSKRDLLPSSTWLRDALLVVFGRAA